jgi:hypothetical protein
MHIEVITPVVILIALTIYLISGLKLSPPVKDRSLQESFFPLLIYILGAPTAIVLFFSAVKKSRLEGARQKDLNLARPFKKPFLIAIISTLFSLGFEPLGFFVIAPLYLFFFMFIFDDKPQQILRKMIYSVFITAFVYVLYAVIFSIKFPQLWR